MVLNPLQRSRAKCLSADEGGKLSERSEFLTPPQSNASRGQPKAKLLGCFSLVRFFVPHKEMNIKYLTF
jgi:hypothetical protein